MPAPYKPVEKVGKEPTTLAELAANAERSAPTWMKNHDVLLNILLGPFEANWFKAKACLTMDQWPASCEVKPSHEVSIKLMQALVVMRKAKWGAFVKDVVKPQFDERMRMFGQAEVPAPSGPGEQGPLPPRPSRRRHEVVTRICSRTSICRICATATRTRARTSRTSSIRSAPKR